MVSFYKKEDLEKTHKAVNKNATPQQRKLMSIVDGAFREVSSDFDNRMDRENALREWASDLLGGIPVTVTMCEELRDLANKQPVCTEFYYAGRSVYKTAFNTLDSTGRYVKTLEATTIDVTNNSQFSPLGSYELIKLAFKKLFRRN